MPTQRPRYMVTLDDETIKEIEKFQRDNNISTRSKATVTLLEIGMEKVLNEIEQEKQTDAIMSIKNKKIPIFNSIQDYLYKDVPEQVFYIPWTYCKKDLNCFGFLNNKVFKNDNSNIIVFEDIHTIRNNEVGCFRYKDELFFGRYKETDQEYILIESLWDGNTRVITDDQLEVIGVHYCKFSEKL